MFLVFELNYLQYFLQGCDLPPPHTPALASTMFFLGNSFFSPFFCSSEGGKVKEKIYPSKLLYSELIHPHERERIGLAEEESFPFSMWKSSPFTDFMVRKNLGLP